MLPLHEHRWLIVTGKGGAGKTTVTAALAMDAARRGKRVLICMCNARERLSHIFGGEPIGTEIQPLIPGVDAVNVTPASALSEYGMMVLKVRLLYRMIFENRVIAAFLRAAPGLDTWAVFGKTWFHTTETLADGRPRYDLVLVDAPATGHAVEMLRLPKVILDVAPPGLLRREAERAWTQLRDPSRSGVVLVTLPEEMPVTETIELHKVVAGELGLPIPRLVVNARMPRLFEAAEHELLRTLPGRLPAESPLLGLARAARRRVVREALEARSVQELAAALPLPRSELPFLFSADFGRDEIASLADALAVDPQPSSATAEPREQSA